MKYTTGIGTILVTGILFFSCSNGPGEKKSATPAVETKTATIRFTPEMVDNRKDPSCGMPISAGIEDTVHYKNKILGFCSKECKDEFLHDPEKNIVAADLK